MKAKKYTPEEKASFWLAFYQGKKLQARYGNDKWKDIANGHWLNVFINASDAIRIAPSPIQCVPYRRFIEKQKTRHVVCMVRDDPAYITLSLIEKGENFIEWLDNDWQTHTVEAK